jgi:hypothetical protein
MGDRNYLQISRSERFSLFIQSKPVMAMNTFRDDDERMVRITKTYRKDGWDGLQIYVHEQAFEIDG